jgi:thymidylate synthase
MKQYLNALQFILDNGQERSDRTGTGTIGVFGMQQRYDLSKSFPAVTTKKLAWKAMVGELLWFIEGSSDERRLAELTHGTRDKDKTTIWTANALSPKWTSNAKFYGDLGRVYGVQWRSWNTHQQEWVANGVNYKDSVIDQLANLIDGIKTDPFGRRHILTAWNPAELDEMALPPCHCFAQFYVSADSKLSCQMYQRSADFFLGVPFNIASYSLFTHMIAQVCGLQVGEFIHTLGDAHIYINHIEQVKEQINRVVYAGPNLWLNPEITEIDKFTMDDIRLCNYQHHNSIKALMAV